MAATPLSSCSELTPRADLKPDRVGLDTLAPGESALVCGLTGDGPIERRLLDLGLLPGTRVLALRRAPLGDPIEYELRGYRLCLRRSEARRVCVEREAAGACADAPR